MATLGSRAITDLTHDYLERYPEEAARILENRPLGEVVSLLSTQPTSRAARVVGFLTPEVGSYVLEHLDLARARPLLPLLNANYAAELLSRLDPELQKSFLESLDSPTKHELEALMTYPPDTAGSLMDTRVTTFHPDTTVKEALARLRLLSKQKKIFQVFLVDTNQRLVGIVPLQDIALADSNQTLQELASLTPVSIQATAPREEVVELLTQRGLPILPVVDFEGNLVGVIRHDALVKAVEEETTADIQTMVGASKEERALSKVSFAVRKRLPWLEINLLTAFLAAAVVGLFEGIIAKFTALAVLLPVVAGQSGNTGAQALAVTMRGLALREIRPRHWIRITFKEANVAFINSIAVALTTSLGVYIWSRSIGLALVIGLSMVISMVAAGLSGAAIPMILEAFGQDPAQSSSIILTTVTDVVGFFSFLGIATMLSFMLIT